MPESPWLNANGLVLWLAEREIDGETALDHIERINQQRGIEQMASAAIKTEVDAQLYRENLAKLDRLEGALWEGLREWLPTILTRGDFLAFAMTSPRSELAPIPPNHWRFLEIDFDRNRATGPDLAYYGLQFVYINRLSEVRDQLPERWRRLGLPKEPAQESPRDDAPNIHRTGAPGRPSSRHLVDAEFARRVESGEALSKLHDEANALADWLLNVHPEAPRMTAKTIKNTMREAHRAFRSRGPEKP